jgi:hypothetical protein
MIQWLRCHGLVKKIGRTYKYYVTSAGRSVMTAGLKRKTAAHSGACTRHGRAIACRKSCRGVNGVGDVETTRLLMELRDHIRGSLYVALAA